MKQKEIYVLGIGGSTPVFIDIAESCGYKIAGLYHYNADRTGECDHEYPILGSFNDLYHSDIRGKMFLLSQGDMKIREVVTNKLKSLGGIVPTLVHPTAIISKYAKISEEGVVIGANCIVQADSVIKSNAVLWDMALVCHQTTIGNYCFVGPKALVGAHIEVKDFAFIGQDALLVSGKVGTMGANSLLGAGAVLTKELPANVVAVGNPARVIKERKL